ncbi:GCN5 family acetyltransferase [Burkholderia territorii]|uniref:GNAT family N-acetyltransferase n=1 Tax=Burkholderia territorii TaxID=1503055 RepID=UPI00075DEF97|nr:GNAT family N-acetyltransferase [Burkholderia territorii]KVQ50172.1 GCN5 family acetyltransferase [Burkholderia territorii]
MLQMRPMTAGEFHAYRTRAIDGYARDLVSSGQNAADDAASRARACFDTLLPDGLLTDGLLTDGLLTAGQTLVQLIDAASGDTVGDLWYAIVPEGPNRTLFIYDLDIIPTRRREGWATRALDALEAEARRHGVTGIGLSVFNHNTAARALYRACGFVPITTTLIKPVVPG